LPYLLVVLDDYSRYSEVRCLSSKGEAADAKIKCARTDGGKEFLGAPESELQRDGVKHQKTVPCTPQQNGRAERLNRTLMEKTRALLKHSEMPKVFWVEAVRTANFLQMPPTWNT
jgi:transposase InsO family protein